MRKIWLSGLGVASSLTVALLACGDTVRNPVDPDASVDAASPDASTVGIVTATVSKNESAFAGATVVFQNADDTVVATLTTDAGGVASTTMKAGGSVTVIFPAVASGSSARLQTIAGVKAGDNLIFGTRNVAPTTNNKSILLPSLPRGASSNVVTPCGSVNGQGSPLILPADSSCTTGPLFLSSQAIGAGPDLGSLYKPSVTFTGASAIDLSLEVLKPAKPLTFVLNNIPATFTAASITSSAFDGKILMNNSSTARLQFATPLGTTRAGDIQLPDVATADLVTTIQLSQSGGRQEIYDRAAFAPQTFDATAIQIPWLLTPPTYDVTSSQIAWTESSDGAADTTFSFLNVSRGNTSFSHDIVSAHGSASQHVPVLPVAQAEFNVLASDTVNKRTLLIKTQLGFDSIRARIFVLGDAVELLPTRGRAVVSSINGR
jgi:hypothetical protein